jgi:hypothetical protein
MSKSGFATENLLVEVAENSKHIASLCENFSICSLSEILRVDPQIILTAKGYGRKRFENLCIDLEQHLGVEYFASRNCFSRKGTAPSLAAPLQETAPTRALLPSALSSKPLRMVAGISERLLMLCEGFKLFTLGDLDGLRVRKLLSQRGVGAKRVNDFLSLLITELGLCKINGVLHFKNTPRFSAYLHPTQQMLVQGTLLRLFRYPVKQFMVHHKIHRLRDFLITDLSVIADFFDCSDPKELFRQPTLDQISIVSSCEFLDSEEESVLIENPEISAKNLRWTLKEILQMFFEFLKAIKRRPCKILKLRYADPAGVKSLQEVGDIIGVTRERVRQLEKQGLTALNTQFHLQSLKAQFNYVANIAFAAKGFIAFNTTGRNLPYLGLIRLLSKDLVFDSLEGRIYPEKPEDTKRSLRKFTAEIEDVVLETVIQNGAIASSHMKSFGILNPSQWHMLFFEVADKGWMPRSGYFSEAFIRRFFLLVFFPQGCYIHHQELRQVFDSIYGNELEVVDRAFSARFAQLTGGPPKPLMLWARGCYRDILAFPTVPKSLIWAIESSVEDKVKERSMVHSLTVLKQFQQPLAKYGIESEYALASVLRLWGQGKNYWIRRGIYFVSDDFTYESLFGVFEKWIKEVGPVSRERIIDEFHHKRSYKMPTIEQTLLGDPRIALINQHTYIHVDQLEVEEGLESLIDSMLNEIASSGTEVRLLLDAQKRALRGFGITNPWILNSYLQYLRPQYVFRWPRVFPLDTEEIQSFAAIYKAWIESLNEPISKDEFYLQLKAEGFTKIRADAQRCFQVNPIRVDDFFVPTHLIQVPPDTENFIKAWIDTALSNFDYALIFHLIEDLESKGIDRGLLPAWHPELIRQIISELDPTAHFKVVSRVPVILCDAALTYESIVLDAIVNFEVESGYKLVSGFVEKYGYAGVSLSNPQYEKIALLRESRFVGILRHPQLRFNTYKLGFEKMNLHEIIQTKVIRDS